MPFNPSLTLAGVSVYNMEFWTHVQFPRITEWIEYWCYPSRMLSYRKLWEVKAAVYWLIFLAVYLSCYAVNVVQLISKRYSSCRPVSILTIWCCSVPSRSLMRGVISWWAIMESTVVWPNLLLPLMPKLVLRGNHYHGYLQLKNHLATSILAYVDFKLTGVRPGSTWLFQPWLKIKKVGGSVRQCHCRRIIWIGCCSLSRLAVLGR